MTEAVRLLTEIPVNLGSYGRITITPMVKSAAQVPTGHFQICRCMAYQQAPTIVWTPAKMVTAGQRGIIVAAQHYKLVGFHINTSALLAKVIVHATADNCSIMDGYPYDPAEPIPGGLVLLPPTPRNAPGVALINGFVMQAGDDQKRLRYGRNGEPVMHVAQWEWLPQGEGGHVEKLGPLASGIEGQEGAFVFNFYEGNRGQALPCYIAPNVMGKHQFDPTDNEDEWRGSPMLMKGELTRGGDRDAVIGYGAEMEVVMPPDPYAQQGDKLGPSVVIQYNFAQKLEEDIRAVMGIKDEKPQEEIVFEPTAPIRGRGREEGFNPGPGEKSIGFDTRTFGEALDRTLSPKLRRTPYDDSDIVGRRE